jgi:hypothetical protein
MEVPRDEEGVTLNRDPAAASRDGWVLTRAVGSKEVKRRFGRPSGSPDARNNHFCYLPGLPYEDYRSVGAGMLVPAGTDMHLSLHYTANGLAVVDRTRIGFTVTKVAPKKRFLSQDGSIGEDAPVAQQRMRELAIPPYAENYVAPLSVITALRDLEVVWYRPHAHQRAKTARYTAVYPDGREEILLDVPRYDFNWQLTYRTSVKIPKGTAINVQFTYDNSTKNKYNPDPSKWVYYGDQTWEEMGTPNIGFLVDASTPLMKSKK